MELKNFSYYFSLDGFEHQSLFANCGYIFDAIKVLPDYIKNNLRPRILGKVMEGAKVEGEVFLGEGSVVQPGAWVRGPAIIGKNCEIRHGAYVGANILTGDNVVIGHATETGHAIFLNHAKAPHFAFVGHSILGNNVNLGAGTKLSNLKVTSTEIEIDGVKTGLIKVGAFIGDDSSLGCNTVTQPGAFIGKRVFSYPNMTIRGFVPSETILKLRQNQEEAKAR